MRVLFLCGREPSYIRNLMLRRALRRSFDVHEITSDAPHALSRNLSVGIRYPRSALRACDVIVVSFYGHPLMPWVRLWARAPILFDPYVSTYDTLCFDRRRFGPDSAVGRLTYALDLWTCRWASHLLMDTRAHRDYFARTFLIPPAKMDVLYVGCDESHFSPRPESPDTGHFEVFTYSSFLRLHGVEHVIDAAHRLQAQRDLVFTIAGAGPGLPQMRRMVEDLGLENVRFPGWLPFEVLPDRIAQAGVCLGGHFSDVAKASRVIATKTYQFLAMEKATIVGDNPANREILGHGESAHFCTMADAGALAEAIHRLYWDRDLRREIARGGRHLFEANLSLAAQAERLRSIVEGML